MASEGKQGTATYDAAPNIALIKYWGMRDPSLGLPTNSSLSVTLDRLRSRTTVRFDPALSEDEFTLNGIRPSGGPLDAVVRFLDRVRGLAGFSTHAEVTSSNNFQTASGLASSASGFAALAGAASHAAGLALPPRKLSQLARFGSGSASRSVFGGFVEWEAGNRPDGEDCYARPLYDSDHWPTLVDVVALVAGAPEKSVRSAEAMQASVGTSPGYAARQAALPARLRAVREAIRRRDGPRLFELIMEECDDFRRVCETTQPALDYLTPVSRQILATVHDLNRTEGRTLAGYTHDAGGHVHIFTLADDASLLRRRLADIEGISRVLTLHPGPGGHLVQGPSPRRR